MSARTPGPWEVDTIDNAEAEYGDGGPESSTGFTSYAVRGPDGNILFDSLNSEAALVHEVFDDEDGYCHAWDEVARQNLTLAAAAPDMLALLTELVDIEGPCPGTAEWAEKVRALIAKATTP